LLDPPRKEVTMDTFWAVITIALVVAIVAAVLWAFVLGPVVVPGRKRGA
jgi:hypothetical protein